MSYNPTIPSTVPLSDSSVPSASSVSGSTLFVVSSDNGATLQKATGAQILAYAGSSSGSTKITVNPIADVATVSTAFTVSGTFSGYGGVPTLSYAYGVATPTSLPSPTITYNASNDSGTFSYINPGYATQTGFAVIVISESVYGTSGVSNYFQIGAAVPTFGSLLWSFDASAQYGMMYTDAGRTTQTIPSSSASFTAGAAVAGLKDPNGYGNHFSGAISGTTTALPFLQTNVKNGMPGLRFTGSAQTFLSTISTSVPLLAKLQAGNVFIGVVGTLASNTATMEGFSAGNANGSIQYPLVKPFESRTTFMYGAVNGTSAFNNLISAQATSANLLVKQSLRYATNNATMTQALMSNGGTEITTPSALGPLGTFNNAMIGGCPLTGALNTNATSPFDGWIHEIRIFNTYGTNANASSWYTYATAKWGS